MNYSTIEILKGDIKIDNISQGTTAIITPSYGIAYYYIKGSATLGADLSISIRTTGMAVGDKVVFEYGASVNLSTYTLSIAGNSLSTKFTSIPLTITCIYNGTNLITITTPSLESGIQAIDSSNISGTLTTSQIGTGAIQASNLAANAVTTVKILDANVTETKLATNSVTTTKIANGAVEVEKLENQALESSLVIPIHFDYASKDSYYLTIPTKCTAVRLYSTVSGTAIDGSNAATMTIYNETGAAALLSTGTLHAAGTAENNNALISLSNTSINQGDIIRFTPDGSATSGKVFLTLTLRRNAD